MRESQNQPTLYGLREQNLRRLYAEVFNNPIAAVGYDIDGTIRANGITDPEILSSQAEMLSQGMVGGALTARGESAYFVLPELLLPYLHEKGLDPNTVPFFMTTRNGACTEQPYAQEILDEHPLTNDLYREIVNNPLAQALEILTPQHYPDDLGAMYKRFEVRWGVEVDPLSLTHPAILHDVHRINGKRYKLTLYYNMRDVLFAEKQGDSKKLSAIKEIKKYTGGQLPRSPTTMSQVLGRAFVNDGIPASVNSSLTDPEIDITVSGVDKSNGYRVIRNVAAELYRLKPEDVDKHIITIGDSPDPTYNDEALVVNCGVGVTNVNYFNHGGNPIVLDIPGDKIQRVRVLFHHIKRMRRFHE